MTAAIPTALTEVRQADASPEVRAIYADICTASGVPQVNLIYRHLATEPPVLAWVWQTLAPAYRSGTVAAMADDLSRSVAGDGGPPLWHELPDEIAGQAEAVLAFYNRANPQNIIALTALVKAARGGSGALPPVDGGAAATTRTAAAWQLPPLPRRDALDASRLALIDDLALRQGGGTGVTPSLYLHLAHWPAAICAAAARVAPFLGTADFAARVAAVVAEADRQADRLARTLALGAPPPAAVIEPRLAVVEQFVAATIPQMIVVGRILSGAPRRT